MPGLSVLNLVAVQPPVGTLTKECSSFTRINKIEIFRIILRIVISYAFPHRVQMCWMALRCYKRVASDHYLSGRSSTGLRTLVRLVLESRLRRESMKEVTFVAFCDGIAVRGVAANGGFVAQDTSCNSVISGYYGVHKRQNGY